MINKRKSHQIIFNSLFIFVLLVAALLSGLSGTKVFAVTGSDWVAGSIIDDSYFYDNNAMSVSDIQNFLNSKVPTCDTQGTQSAADDGYPNLTHAQYAAQQGWPGPPYICLKDYMQVPDSTQIIDNYSGSVPQGAISAAQIIKNAADSYGVSPKAILVTLQKESLNLIYDTWPLQSQYKNAMGYGCPDNAPCDPSYAGFYNQINNMAWQFNQYKLNPGSYRYQPFQANTIYYNPSDTTDPTPSSTACGASSVVIQDYATAGLYNYTPYQPNQAALNNLYGNGDSCSSYGNRNFWRVYNDWFGPTSGPGYSFSGATNPSSTIAPNQIQNVSITLTNTSGDTWYSDGNVPAGGHPTRLAMRYYQNSPYANTADPAWLGTQNQVKMDQASVAPGGTASFTFSLRAPVSQISSYTMQFAPVLDGVHFYPFIGMQWTISTPSPDLSYQVVSSTPLPATSSAGSTNPVQFTIKNTGNTVWYSDHGSSNPIGAHSVRLFTTSPNYHASPFYDAATWLANNQVAMNNTSPVNPGDTATFSFNAITPDTNALNSETFGLIIDGARPLPLAAPINISTTATDYRYAFVSSTIPSSPTPGKTYTATVVLQNTGTQTWYADGSVPAGGHPLRLATRGYQRYPFATPTSAEWLGTNNQVSLATPSVAPGQNGTFNLTLTVPYDTAGTTVNTFFEPVVDGKYFLPTTFSSNSSVPALQGSYQTVAGTINPPSVMSPGQVANAKLMIKNNTNYPWYADGSTPSGLAGGAMRVLMVNPLYRSSAFANSADSAWLSTSSQIKMVTPVVNPGESGEFDFTWKAPLATGTYSDNFDLVIDGYYILPYQGMNFTTTVQ